MKALEENLMDKFEDILSRSDVNVNFRYSYPHTISCLHYAVRNQNETAIRLLLKRGAECEVKDRNMKTPLHHATEQMFLQGFKSLLEKGAKVNAKDKLDRNCLHMTVLGWPKNPAVSEEILEAALGVDGAALNDLDCSQSSPLLLAARAGAWSLCSRLLKKGADIDCSSFGSESARQLIAAKSPDLLSLATEKVVRDPAQLLFEVLTLNDLDQFLVILQKLKVHEDQNVRQEALNRRQGQRTPLEQAVFQGLNRQAIELIRAGAELDMSTHQYGYNPFQNACVYGNHEILRELVDATKRRGVVFDPNQPQRLKETLMHLITRNASQSEPKYISNYVKCAEALFEHYNKPDLDAQDELGNTATHYASLMDDSSLLLMLLRHGASLGVENDFGTMPISRISEPTLRTAFDQSIRHNGVAATSENLHIHLHYDLLIPPGNSDSIVKCTAETMPLLFVSQSVLHHKLLLHPLVESFLALKWYKLRTLYWLSVLCYLLFIVILTAYMVLVHSHKLSADPTAPSSISQPLTVNALYVMLCLMTLFYLLFELNQMAISFVSYMLHVTNALQLSMLILIGVLLLPLQMDEQVRLYLSAWALILSWITLVIIVGKHPYLSQFIMVFGAVGLNFAKFILLFSSVFVAFAIGFYFLFVGDDQFSTFWRSQLRVLAMTLGELEYTSLQLESYTGYHRLAYVLFVFLVSIVLMNVLNGLAVSDTANILTNAKLNSRKSTVKLILYVERLLISLPKYCCCLCKFHHRFSVWLMHKTLLFPRCLKEKKLTVCPNKVKFEDRFLGCSCHNFQLSGELVETLQLWVRDGDNLLSDRVQSLELKIDSILSLLRELRPGNEQRSSPINRKYSPELFESVDPDIVVE